MSTTIEIVLVDDHRLFREGVAHTLPAEADLCIVGQGVTAADAVRLCSSLLPDLLLDINLPGGGLSVVQVIAAACPVTKIVMLTASEAEDDLVAALRAGARGYIVKGVSARRIVAILQSVNAGEA